MDASGSNAKSPSWIRHTLLMMAGLALVAMPLVLATMPFPISFGDADDDDPDGDGKPNSLDGCPGTSDGPEIDSESQYGGGSNDGIPDACDPNKDNDYLKSVDEDTFFDCDREFVSREDDSNGNGCNDEAPL